MDEDVEEQNLPFNQPTSVFISGPAKTENALSGSINQNNENKNITSIVIFLNENIMGQ
ncbi:MAG: hypothetical protein ACPG8U_02975 [Candidatus Thalassarchaeaceae archaeon]